jgi:hypothetical protein
LGTIPISSKNEHGDALQKRCECGNDHKGNSMIKGDPTVRRAELSEQLNALRNAALVDLERRGYDVRGKTPGQIRQMLRRRPPKPKSNAQGCS